MTPEAVMWHHAQAVEIDRANMRAMGLAPQGSTQAAMPQEIASTSTLEMLGFTRRRKAGPSKLKGGKRGG